MALRRISEFDTNGLALNFGLSGNMRSLNNPGVTIPGGFRIYCEDTKSHIPATGHIVGYHDFIQACRKHYAANNLPIGSQWEQQIQDKLCIGLDHAWCNDGTGIPIAPSGGWAFTLQAVVQGTKTLAQWLWKANGVKVEIAEAERRAAICVGCSQNQDPIGCSACNIGTLHAAANIVVGGSTTRYDSQLRSCRVCGCSLRAKIHLPLDILQANLSDTQMNALPEHCWLK